MSDKYYMRKDTVTLLDILDRILDKGVVIVGDITISLCDIELINIRLKLLIASVETAKQMGMDFGWAGAQDGRLSERERKKENVVEVRSERGGRRGRKDGS